MMPKPVVLANIFSIRFMQTLIPFHCMRAYIAGIS